MPTHSLPTKGFMHVKVAQWVVPLVRNPRNNYETRSRVLGCLLLFWQFPTLASLRCLSLMKWKAANRLWNSSAFFGFHVKWFFWDGLCSNVLCPFLKDAEEEHLCSTPAALPAELPSSSRKPPNTTVPSPHKHCLNQSLVSSKLYCTNKQKFLSKVPDLVPTSLRKRGLLSQFPYLAICWVCSCNATCWMSF